MAFYHKVCFAIRPDGKIVNARIGEKGQQVVIDQVDISGIVKRQIAGCTSLTADKKLDLVT